MRRAWTLALVLVMAACGPGGTAANDPSSPDHVPGADVQPGQPFRLAPGTTAELAGTRLVLRFDAVTEDSRCPSNVQCIWAGRAVVQLSLSDDGAATRTALLSTLPDATSASFAGYRVTLVKVEPYPAEGSPIEPGAYRATLRIDAGG